MRRRLPLLLLCWACAGDDPPPPPSQAPVRPPDPAAVHAGGSGALTPLLTRLAAAWAALGGTPPVLVEESIGSGGGVRAAADGAVDLGLVSRELSEEERGLGLALTPLGRDLVAIVAHPAFPFSGLRSDELVALYRGARLRLPDGHFVSLLLRDRSESANFALERWIPELRGAREEAYRARRLRVIYHDRAMAEALRATPGALGVLPLGAILAFHIPLKVLSLDGVAPSQEALAAGRWRAGRTLFIVVRPDRLDRVEPFLRFARSPKGRDLARAAGYLPDEAGP